MAKLIHEVADWETKLAVTELPDNGLKVRTSEGWPTSKGCLDVNLSYEEGFELMQSLHEHYRGRRS